MKTTALVCLLLLAACASPTAVMDQRQLQCGPGQDVEIRAGIADPATAREQNAEYMILVEVANNSHEDVTVKSVGIDPEQRDDRRPVPFERVHRAYDQLIPEGTEHVFKIPAPPASMRMRGPYELSVSEAVEFFVTVSLSNGDSYRCRFGGQV